MTTTALSEVKPPRDGLLYDSQWANIVNHDNAYCGWDVEEAVNHAVKATLAAVKSNIESALASAEPVAWELTCHGTVQQIVRREDVAAERLAYWRTFDPDASCRELVYTHAQPAAKVEAPDLVLQLLVAGGFVDPAKVEQAREIIAGCAPTPKDANSDIVREAIAILRDMPTDRIEYNEELSALIRKLKPASPKDAGAVPLPKMVGMISDRPICFQDEVARYGNAREAAGRADAVPDGYALVPAIPTEAMTDAYWRAVVLPDNARLSDRPKAVARWQAMLSAAPLPQHPPATRVQVVTLFGHPKRNLYHRPQGLSETVGGFDLRSREIGAAIEPFGVVNQQLTAGDVVSPAYAADIDPWATLIVLCEALGIDIQEARSVPGKPSDVILEAARKKFSEPAHAGAGDAHDEYLRIYSIAITVCGDQQTAAEIARRLAGGGHA